LADGRTYSGEMSLFTQDGLVKGTARYTSGAPDQGYEQTFVTGAAAEGGLFATMVASFGGNLAVVVLASASVRTSADTFSTSVLWFTDRGDTNGTMVAIRRK